MIAMAIPFLLVISAMSFMGVELLSSHHQRWRPILLGVAIAELCGAAFLLGMVVAP